MNAIDLNNLYNNFMNHSEGRIKQEDTRVCVGCGNYHYTEDMGLLTDGYGARVPACHTCGPLLDGHNGSTMFHPDYWSKRLEADDLAWCDECGCELQLEEASYQYKQFRHRIFCHSCCRDGGLVDGIKCHVNVYLEDRAFGGHEEGGWYYDCGQIIVSVPVTKSVCPLLVKLDLEDTYSNEGRAPISSVLSDGEYSVRLELLKGENYPKVRPHYE